MIIANFKILISVKNSPDSSSAVANPKNRVNPNNHSSYRVVSLGEGSNFKESLNRFDYFISKNKGLSTTVFQI